MIINVGGSVNTDVFPLKTVFNTMIYFFYHKKKKKYYDLIFFSGKKISVSPFATINVFWAIASVLHHLFYRF